MTDWKVFEQTPTIELINLIKLKNSPEHLENATTAFHAFCFRFQKKLTKRAEYISKNNGQDLGFAIEIVEKTFENFWKYPTFNPDRIKASTLERGVELYLSKIAQNSFYDLINKRNGVNISPYDGHENIVYEMPQPLDSIDVNNENYRILMKVFESFSWKHKVIYLTYCTYETNGFKLPRTLLTELRRELGVSQTTIRQYKFEVNTKITEFKKLWQEKNEIRNK